MHQIGAPMVRHSSMLLASSSRWITRGRRALLVGFLVGLRLFGVAPAGAQELADDRSGSEYYFATPVFSDGFESGDTDAWLGPFLLTVAPSGPGVGTITSNPIGIACGADCSETYNHGVVVTLTASPSGSSNFAGWSGGGCGGVGTCVVTMTAATSVTADFTLNQYTLTTAKSGTGTGTITSSPAGINCGATCSASFDQGTQVTLTAASAVGSTFAGWSGGGCSGTGTCIVTMTAATTVTATFTLNQYTLSVSKLGAPLSTGTVTSAPAGINCGVDCSEDFADGTSVTLTAVPDSGSLFVTWIGGGCSGAGTCTVIMTSAIGVTAMFN